MLKIWPQVFNCKKTCIFIVFLDNCGFFFLIEGEGKSRFIVVHMEKNTIINNSNAGINSVFHVLTTINLLLPRLVWVIFINPLLIL